MSHEHKHEPHALTTQGNAGLPVAQDDGLGIDAKDLLIASIQIMQPMSELVGQDKAKLGDIVNMQTEEILGSLGKPVQFLPLTVFKTLRVYDVTDKARFLYEQPLTDANSKLPTEDVENGVEIKRYHTFNYFVLLKTDLEKGEGFPCLIRFKSTGTTAGRTLATHIWKSVKFFNKPAYYKFVELGVKKEMKDKNAYAVPTISLMGTPNASKEDMEQAQRWVELLQQAKGNYRVVESEDAASGPVAAEPTTVQNGVAGQPDGDY